MRSTPAGLTSSGHAAVTDVHAYTMLLAAQSSAAADRLDDEVEAVRAVAQALRAHVTATPGGVALTAGPDEPLAPPPGSGSEPAS